MSARLTRSGLEVLLGTLDERLDRPAHLFLAGESALLLAGVREWTNQPVVYTAGGDDVTALEKVIAGIVAESPVAWVCESPADVVPLPPGHEERARAAGWQGSGRLRVSCFDPFSIAIRALARGDEPDYHVVLDFLRLGWITFPELDRMLEELLPLFSRETLAQDPAEFRRKFKGLRQMWRADEGRRGKGSRAWQDTPREDTLT